MISNPPTRGTLLVRIRDAQDGEAWADFTALYSPLIYGFARKYGLQDADAADLTQDVLQLVAAAFKGQQYDAGRGSFRPWLYTVVRNQVRKMLGRRKAHQQGAGGTEAQVRLEQHLSPERDETDQWNADYQQRMFVHAASQVRGDFKDATWRAFWATSVERRPAKEVAAVLELTVAAVYLAKGRVMARLKEQIEMLQGESG
jgi:RNA polymerase sigma factor (sigma-70 family)